MERSLLACLVAQAGASVSVDWLTDQLWLDGRLPQRPHKRVQMLVSRLRGHLDDVDGEYLRTDGTGYSLQINHGDTDAGRFEDLVASGAQALRDGEAQSAAQTLAEALDLWRGVAYADAGPAPAVSAEADRLDQVRLAAVEDRIDAELRCGRHAVHIATVQSLVSEFPLRERLVGLLMLGLYRSGRQADALNAYTRIRESLAEELGVDPGPELQRLHQRILETDAVLDSPVEPTLARTTLRAEAIAQLPSDLSVFSGREAELSRLVKLSQTTATSTSAVIVTVSGTAGVGKTTLAVHAAHQVADQFPDAQLYVDLRGFDPSDRVVKPSQAIRGFLDALGAAAERVPTDLDAQVGLYRSLLADKRVMVVMDNAPDSEHVRPLLPGSSGSLALVTSRNALSGLVARDGATSLSVDTLAGEEARTLLTKRLGTDRVSAEPEAVDAIIASTAGLPLALAIVSARAAAHPGFPLGSLAGELRAGLDALHGGDSMTDPRAVFSWSYRQLSAEAARLFRLLGLHPGPDLSTAAAASLAGVRSREAVAFMRELTAASLVSEHAPGRYRFHDLLRAYAAELADVEEPAEQRDRAIHRLLDHYVHSANAYMKVLEPDRHVQPNRQPQPLRQPLDGVISETTARDNADALSWFNVERQVLLAVIDLAAELGYDTYVIGLAWPASLHLRRKGYWNEHARIWQTAIAAARRNGDRAGEALAHRALAQSLRRLDRLDDAELHLHRALRRYQDLGDVAGQAATRHGLVEHFLSCGRCVDAFSQARDSVDLYQATDQPVQLANALNALAWCSAQLGRHEEALQHGQDALAQLADFDDPVGEASTLDTLGYAHHHLGNFGLAIDCYQRSLSKHGGLGDLLIRAETFDHLGDSRFAVGEQAAAAESWRTALTILEDLGRRDADAVRSKLDALGS